MANQCSDTRTGWWRWSRAAIALVPGFLILASPAFGRDGSGPKNRDRIVVHQERLNLVSKEIVRLQNRLDNFRRTQGSILDLLEEMDLQAALLEQEVALLQDRIGQTEISLRRTRQEVAENRAMVEAEKQALALWLRRLYTKGPVPYLALLLGARDANQLLHAYRYASFLTEAEADRLARYRLAVVDLEDVEDRLMEEEEELNLFQQGRKNRIESLESIRRKKHEELEKIKYKMSETEKIYLDLSRTEADLRLLLETLGRDQMPMTPGKIGLDRFHGMLGWPVEGPVRVPFGKRLHPRFGTVTLHPGVAIGVEPGRAIHAIFDGKAVFCDWFRGYGNMVILDHGQGFMSIYAHASLLLVEPGDEVFQGDVIAKTGDTGSLEGPELYFEIRENGLPVDPVPWLRRP